MSGPRNNLDELRRKQGGDGIPVSRPAQLFSKEKSFKFKPAKSFTAMTPEHVTVRKTTAALPAFSTPGFGKSKPPPLALSSGDRSYISISSTDSSSLSASTSSVPSKRLSLDASVDQDPTGPTKRARSDAASDKENIFVSDPKGKGRAREQPVSRILDFHAQDIVEPSPVRRPVFKVSPIPPRPGATPSGPRPRTLPLDWSDLLGMSEADLSVVLNNNFDLRSMLSERIIKHSTGEDSSHDVVLLQHLDKLVGDRIASIIAIRSARSKGEQPALLPPSWSPREPNSVPAESSAAHTRGKWLPSTIDTIQSSSTTLDDDSGLGFFETSAGRNAVASTSNMLDIEPTSDNTYWDADDKNVAANLSNNGPPPPPPAPATPPSSHPRQPAASSLAVTHNSELKKSRHYPEIMRKLREVYGLESFREHQLEAITAVLDGLDVFVLMPTGGGKSLCYQLPSVCRPGHTTFVISPLRSLMHNQVMALKKRGVDVLLFKSDQDSDEAMAAIARLWSKDNRPSLVYVTPEKLQQSTSLLKAMLQMYSEGVILMFAADEAHCISMWGRDFRESYKELRILRERFPNVPIMAMTGTATPQVIDDIIHHLRIQGCLRLTQSHNRTNLKYTVVQKIGTGIQGIAAFIKANHPGQTGVIYTSSREKTENIVKELREKYNLSARFYHAGMDEDHKTRNQEAWQNGMCKIVVATNAFGMGIDKPDVRFVIHHTLPRNLESYYQETGRGGRDGKPADCVLFYSYGDYISQMSLINRDDKDGEMKEFMRDGLRRVMQFAGNDTDCRRVQVLSYFGENNFDPRNCHKFCDNCCNMHGIVDEDVTAAAVNIVRRGQDLLGKRRDVTTNQLIEIIKGSRTKWVREQGHDQHELFSVGRDMLKGRIARLVNQLEVEGVFDQVTKVNGNGWSNTYLKLGRKGHEWLKRPSPLVIRFRTVSSTDIGAPKRQRRAADASASTRTRRNGKQKETHHEDNPMDMYIDDNDEGRASQPDHDDNLVEFMDPPPIAGRLTHNRATYRRASERDSDIEVVENFNRPVSDIDPWESCRKELQQMRQKIADEEGADPENILSDYAMDMLSAIMPNDMNSFNNELREAEINPEGIIKPHRKRLLNVCIAHHIGRDSHRNMSKPPSAAKLREQFEYRK